MKLFKKFSLKSRDDRLWGLVFASPFLIGFVIIFLQILISGVQFAFSDVSMGQGLSFEFVGLENFRYALRVDANFIKLLWADLGTLLTTLPVILIFSLLVAVLLNGDVWGRTVFRAIFFLPVIVCTGLLVNMNTSAVDVMATAATENSNSALGDISLFLQNLNFSPQLISIVSGAANNIFEIVNRSGVQILIFLAGIQSISPQLYESAKVEGASSWVVFWKITLPMLSPMMIVNLIYTFVECLTQDGTELLTYIKAISFSKGLFGPASAMAWINCLSIAFIMVVVFVAIRIGQKISLKSKKEEYGI